MHDMSIIGETIARLRKEKGMTQEAFARQIGVSPQAISKWETGAGFPDITLLPLIVRVLETNMDAIFGLSAEFGRGNQTAVPEFPPEQDTLSLAYQYGDVACYSNLPVAETDGAIVRFTDGSEANLVLQKITNQGNADIRLAFGSSNYNDSEAEQAGAGGARAQGAGGAQAQDAGSGATSGTSASGAAEAQRTRPGQPPQGFFVGLEALDLNLPGHVEVLVRPTRPGEEPGYYLEGEQRLRDSFEFDRRGNTLFVKFKQRGHGIFNFNLNFAFGGSNRSRLELFLPNNELQKLNLIGSGSSDVELLVDFHESDIRCSGAGDIKALGLGSCSLSLSGASDLEIVSVKDLDLVNSGASDVNISEAVGKIALDNSGAGDIRIDKIFGSLKCNDSGAGDVSIKTGEVTFLDLTMYGAGDFVAAGLCAKEASITMMGAASAVIGHIVGVSDERISRVSSLKVQRRG